MNYVNEAAQLAELKAGWAVVGVSGPGNRISAQCPTREAAEAARRLLSGKCAQELADAQIDRMVAAKTGCISYACGKDVGYVNGMADGIAKGRREERARIEAILREARLWEPSLADRIEVGAGE